MKKIIAWLLVLALTAAISIGATLAYLTDTDEDVNVMTLGKVKIDQLEYERVDDEKTDKDATVQEFHDNKPLYPGVYETGFDFGTEDNYVNWDQIGKDDYTSGIWNPDEINNEVDKMVFIKNKGNYDAFVRSVFAFEAGKYATLAEFQQMVHLNLNKDDFTWEWVQTPVAIPNEDGGTTNYFVATATYNKVLAPGALTEISLSQIALDKTATNADVEAFGDTYQILVKSQAIQADGFADAATALNEGFGVIAADNIPWESDAPTTGTTLRNALRYLNGDTTGTNISSRVINAVFALNEEYPEIVAKYDATLVDIEQDVPVNVYYVPNGSDYDVYFLANDEIFAPQDCESLFSGMNKLVTVDAENLDVSRVTNAKNMFLKCPALKSVFGTADWDTGNITCMSSMFDYCGALVDLEVGNWDTSNVTAMDWMFYSNKVASLDVSNWDTGNVTDMHGLFSACINLETVDISKWDVSKVTSFAAMFQGAASNAMDMKIKYLDLTNWNPASAVAMNHMFYGCAQMTELDISGWNMPNLSTTSHMFADCINLNTLDVSGWKTPSLTSMDGMFNDCRALKTIDMSSFDTSKVQEFSQVFESCWSLTEIVGMEKWDTSSGLTFEQMFMGAGALTELDLSGFNTSAAYDGYVAQNGSGCVAFGSMFSGVNNLTKLIVSDEIRYHGNGTVSDGGKLVFPAPKAKDGYIAKWQNVDTGAVYLAKDIPEGVAATYVPYYEYDAKGATMIDALNYLNADSKGTKITANVSNIIFGLTEDYAEIASKYTGVLADQEQEIPVYAYYVPNGSNYDVYMLASDTIYAPVDCSNLCYGMSNLVSVNTANFDTSKTTNMYRMFRECKKLTTIDVSKWDTSNVTNMQDLFRVCSSLTALDVSNWNTGKVENMIATFQECTMTELDLNNWDVSNVKTVRQMFNKCTKLATLKISSWNPKNLSDAGSMFQSCESLNDLDLSGWNTSSLTVTSGMFNHCESITSLNVSTWNMSKVTDCSLMFNCCSKLEQVNLSQWNISSAVSMNSMFFDCKNLIALNVGKWDVSKVTNFKQMFSGCARLEYLHGLGNWNTSSGGNFYAFLNKCASLKEVDLTKFDTSNATNMQFFFDEVFSLQKLTLGEKFSCNANGKLAAGVSAIFPKPAKVEGNDGLWHNVATGEAYAHTDIPQGAATYVAVNPNP